MCSKASDTCLAPSYSHRRIQSECTFFLIYGKINLIRVSEIATRRKETLDTMSESFGAQAPFQRSASNLPRDGPGSIPDGNGVKTELHVLCKGQ